MTNLKTKKYFSKQEIIKRFLDIRFKKIKEKRGYGTNYSKHWDCLKDIINELNSLTDMELVRKVIEEGYKFTHDCYIWSESGKTYFYREMCEFLLNELDKKS